MKVILNLYKTSTEAKVAFNEFTETNNEAITYTSFRDLSLRTFNSYIKFTHYNSNVPSSQQDVICGQYSEINFYVDLPEQVKNHFLSRIRLPNN